MRIETFRKLAKSDIHVDWIVDNLISPGGWSFFVGETGAGKSIMMIQLCDALQVGKPFLGFTTKQHNCLYVQADSGLVEWKTQVETYAGDSFAWTQHEIERGFLDDERERKRLHELVYGTFTPELQGEKNYENLNRVLGGKAFNFVVFDCLHALTNGDLNTKTCMSQVIKHLDQIVTRPYEDIDGSVKLERVHYLLIHHPNAVVKRGAIAGSGHKGFSDACSTKLTLGSNLLVLEKSKVTGKKEILLERHENGEWYIPSSEDEKFDYSSLLGA